MEQDVATLLARAAQYEQLPIKSAEKSKFEYSGTLSGGSRVDQKLRFDTENAHQDARQAGVEVFVQIRSIRIPFYFVK